MNCLSSSALPIHLQPPAQSRPRSWRACLAGLAALVWLAGGPAPLRADSVSPPREFAVKGVVKRLEPGRGQVIIAHEAIPQFMHAMTMPFRVQSPRELDGLAPGDSVSFRLLVGEQESWIDHVAKLAAAAPAPAAAPPDPAPSPAPPSHSHPLLDYAFTNELRQPIRLRDFRGQALALTFIFTRCPIPDYCPRLTKNFEEASRKLRALPGAPTNYHFLSVSFDPDFDSPERLKAYGERFGYDPNHWSFLTGPADKLADLARLSGVKFERVGHLFSHDLRTLIIDPDGRVRSVFPMGGNLAEPIVAELLKAAALSHQPPHAALAAKP